MEQVDAVRLAAEAVRDDMPYAEKYDVSFVVQSPPREAVVWGSREGLLQVFAILLSNAAKFSPTGGVVELSVDVLQSGVRLTVAGDGPGIPLEAQQIIFEKFTQVDSSNTRSKDGTGLGLSIVQAIVRQLGGKMHLESEPGKGSRFYFDLQFPASTDSAGDSLLPGIDGGEPPNPA